MASPDARPRGVLVAAAALALACALFVVERARARPCWGDLQADGYAPTPDVLARLPQAAAIGARARGGVILLGDYELRYTPVYHRFGDTDEIGWSGARIVDPSACSSDGVPLDPRLSGGPIPGDVVLSRDNARAVYVVHDRRSALAVFRRRAAPGVRHALGDALSAIAFDGASALTLAVALVQAARRRPAGALLGISILLSALGGLFGVSG